MARAKSQNQILLTVCMYAAIASALLLLAVSGLAYWASRFTGDMVRSELAAQKIYFPAKGSPALDPAVYPDLQRYAGQLVDTPEEARAYANGYIGRHLKQVADGKVYAEVSTAAMKNPADQKLQQQKQTLFQGETLRGMLLTSGYGFGTAGQIAGVVAVVSFVGGLALLAAAGMLRAKVRA